MSPHCGQLRTRFTVAVTASRRLPRPRKPSVSNAPTDAVSARVSRAAKTPRKRSRVSPGVRRTWKVSVRVPAIGGKRSKTSPGSSTRKKEKSSAPSAGATGAGRSYQSTKSRSTGAFWCSLNRKPRMRFAGSHGVKTALALAEPNAIVPVADLTPSSRTRSVEPSGTTPFRLHVSIACEPHPRLTVLTCTRRPCGSVAVTV